MRGNQSSELTIECNKGCWNSRITHNNEETSQENTYDDRKDGTNGVSYEEKQGWPTNQNQSTKYLIPTVNKWNCHSRRDNQIYMRNKSLIMNSPSLEDNTGDGSQSNHQGTRKTLTLREKLAKQRNENKVTSRVDNDVTGGDVTERAAGRRSQYSRSKASTFGSRSLEGSARDKRGESFDRMTKTTPFGFRVMKCNDKEEGSDLRGEVDVRKMRKPRKTLGNDSDLEKSSFFFTPKKPDNKSLENGSKKPFVDQSKTRDKVKRTEEKSVELYEGAAGNERRGKEEDKEKKERNNKTDRARRSLTRAESLQEGRERLAEFREKQRKERLNRSATVTEKHENKPGLSASSKDICDSLAEIRQRIRERRRKKEMMNRSKSLPEHETVLDEQDKTRVVLGESKHQKKQNKISSSSVVEVESEEQKESQEKSAGLEEKDEMKKREGDKTQRNYDVERKEQNDEKMGMKEKDEMKKIEGDKTQRDYDVERKEQNDEKIGMKEKEEIKKTEEDKTQRNYDVERKEQNDEKIGMKEKEEAKENEIAKNNEVDGNSVSNVEKREETEDKKEIEKENKKQSRRARRRQERYQRSKTMSALIYNDICESSARENKDKTEISIPSVSQIKKQFAMNDTGKLPEPGLSYADNTQEMKSKQDNERTLEYEAISSKKETSSMIIRRHTLHDTGSALNKDSELIKRSNIYIKPKQAPTSILKKEKRADIEKDSLTRNKEKLRRAQSDSATNNIVVAEAYINMSALPENTGEKEQTGKRKENDGKKTAKKTPFYEKYISKHDTRSVSPVTAVKDKEEGDEEAKNKTEKSSVSKLRQMFLGKTTCSERKTKLRERKAKTIAEGISPVLYKEIENRTVVNPECYLAEERNDSEKYKDDSPRKNNDNLSSDTIKCEEVVKKRNDSRECKDESERKNVGGDDCATVKCEEVVDKTSNNLPDITITSATTTSAILPDVIETSHKDQNNIDKQLSLDDYLSETLSFTSPASLQKKLPNSSRLSSQKLSGIRHSSQDMDKSLHVDKTGLTHAWSTSDLDKIFFGGKPDIPHVASEMELSTKDLDDISNNATRLPALTDKRATVRPKRNASKFSNPLKSLQERTDLRTETEKTEKQESEQAGFEKAKKRTNPRKKRSQVEPWRRHTLDPVALAALASREDFSRVSLRKTKGPGKEKDEYDGSKEVMLLQIKGRRQVQTRLVEPKLSSLNSGDCFILVTPKELFCWIGKNANTIEKAKAVEISSKIQKRRDMNCKTGDVLYIDEGKQESNIAYKKFCKILDGDITAPIQNNHLCPEDEFFEREIISTNKLYKLQEGDPPHLMALQEMSGHMPRFSVLNTKEVFVFDFGSEVYVWTGQQSLSAKRKVAFHLAEILFKQPFTTNSVISPLQPSKTLKKSGIQTPVYYDKEGKEHGRPQWALFARLHERAETILFQEKFYDWPDPTKIIKMKGHVSSGEVIERGPRAELTPCDVIEMQKQARPLEAVKLEDTDLGRGMGTPTIEVDGILRHGDLVTTMGLTVFLVTQNRHFILPKESEGHFHSGDGYVVRWVYFVAKNRSVKDKRGRIRPLTGRQRCAYFFWQGNQCSVNEKGAAAIMAVELDEERGPQIRVIEGKEPPHFLKLFDGAMVIHSGKRVRTQDGKDEFSDKSLIRMYCVRNEDTSEGCLVQVRKNASSLRSRSSFIVVDSNCGNIFVWHGCKSSEYHRKVADRAAEYIKERKPLEMRLHQSSSLTLIEMEENGESDLFWKTIGGKRTSYISLIKDPLNNDFSPRLFHLTSTTGQFVPNEILCPSRYPNRTCPFPVLQDDLYSATQPTLFLLDVQNELYIWEGWMPLEITKDKKGSAKRRWDEERKLTLQTALSYINEANNRIKKGAFVVQAGLEPSSFIQHFPFWDKKQHITDIKLQEGKQENEKRPAKEVLETFTKKYYSFKELTSETPPDGIDLSKMEMYLNDEEFEKIFEMKRELFSQLPGWKQDILKKALALF